MLARGLLNFAAYTAYYLGLASSADGRHRRPVLHQPLFITLAAALLLGERVGIVPASPLAWALPGCF